MIQFRVRTLLLLTAVAAIGLVGYQLASGPTLNERLHAAAKAGHQRRFEWLIFLGADVDDGLGKQSYGGTPMMRRASEGDLRAVKMYVQHGAYLDHTEKDLFTAGTLAAWDENWDIVEFLVRSGANYRIPDATGRTVVDYAVEAGRDDIVALLHRHPTPLSQWRIEHVDFPLRGGEREPYNRSYRLMFRTADSSEKIEVAWFKALVEDREGEQTVVAGPIDFQFASDGNSLTVTFANGSVKKILL